MEDGKNLLWDLFGWTEFGMIRRLDKLFDYTSLTERGLILLPGFFNNVITKLGFYRLAHTSMTHAFDRIFK
jgi:hypothetical protein